jgi:3-hydroxybutyryl-CoA dehydrogenase
MSKRKNIAVIGAGLMGHGIAQIFAVHGHPVNLMDLEDLNRPFTESEQRQIWQKPCHRPNLWLKPSSKNRI